MALPIVLYGDPVLRVKCRRVEKITKELDELADEMIETMIDAQGVGLAAPQIGVPIQMAVVDVAHDPECITYLRIDGEDADLEDCMPLVFVNPELTLHKEKEPCEEGCLSIPDFRAEVTRPIEITARLEMLDGSFITVETDGLLARAIQHEVDHLNGILFVDRLGTTGKMRAKREIKKLAKTW